MRQRPARRGLFAVALCLLLVACFAVSGAGQRHFPGSNAGSSSVVVLADAGLAPAMAGLPRLARLGCARVGAAVLHGLAYAGGAALPVDARRGADSAPAGPYGVEAAAGNPHQGRAPPEFVAR